MDQAKNEVIEKVKNFVKHLAKKHSIKAAYIFGSYSIGKAERHSDIDIAIILYKIRDGFPFDETFEIFHEAQQYNSLYEVVCFSEMDFINEDEPIIKHIKEKGLKIF